MHKSKRIPTLVVILGVQLFLYGCSNTGHIEQNGVSLDSLSGWQLQDGPKHMIINGEKAGEFFYLVRLRKPMPDDATLFVESQTPEKGNTVSQQIEQTRKTLTTDRYTPASQSSEDLPIGKSIAIKRKVANTMPGGVNEEIDYLLPSGDQMLWISAYYRRGGPRVEEIDRMVKSLRVVGPFPNQ